MKQPIVQFVKQYVEKNPIRLHMPGHKGKNFLGCENIDITEISGADVLYAAEGIIEESEKEASRLFRTAHSFYSTEGSSLVIKAMLALVSSTSLRPVILATRNVHKSFLYACALLDVEVEWMLEENANHLCSCKIDAGIVEKKLSSMLLKPVAVYLTSPDYLGQMLDIQSIASVCKARNIPLLVDNAHGAYLGFLEQSLHPIDLGASLCCDSAHKTLPVLTGGAYLHVAENTPIEYIQNAREKMSVFASTSPSYLILQSLDLCNVYLQDNYKNRLKKCVQDVKNLKQKLIEMGFSLLEGEPLKIVLSAFKAGYTGTELAKKLAVCGIEVEFCDTEYVVMMFTPEITQEEYGCIEKAFLQIPIKKQTKKERFVQLQKGQKQMSIRKAIFSSHEIVTIEEAVGRICGSPAVSCPPAIPIVICGERIEEAAISLFREYGISKIEVVKEEELL